MTLQVPFEAFAETAKRIADASEAFVIARAGTCIVTCASPAKGVHIVATCRKPLDEVKSALSEKMRVFEGLWTEEVGFDIEDDPIVKAHVAAVAYQSSEHMPGIWVDVFPEQPTHIQALRAMFDEFTQTGEVTDVSFEEFIRQSNPNVVVVTPSQLRGFLDANLAKIDC
jgi:hypothetical protein